MTVSPSPNLSPFFLSTGNGEQFLDLAALPFPPSLIWFPTAELGKFQRTRDDLKECVLSSFFVARQICSMLVCVIENQIQETP